MTSILPASQVQSALPNWRVLAGKVHATFLTGDFATGARFITRITKLAEAANHHPDVDLRYPAVHIALSSHDVGGLTARDVNLADQISQLAAEMSIDVDLHVPRSLEIAIDAMDISAIRPFWQAVLGYGTDGEDALADPLAIDPAVWFQQMDEPRPQRNRVHLDVFVPHNLAEQRMAEAIDAGGRLVSDAEAPAFWVLADAEGNEACICTWQDRE